MYVLFLAYGNKTVMKKKSKLKLRTSRRERISRSFSWIAVTHWNSRCTQAKILNANITCAGNPSHCKWLWVFKTFTVLTHQWWNSHHHAKFIRNCTMWQHFVRQRVQRIFSWFVCPVGNPELKSTKCFWSYHKIVRLHPSPTAIPANVLQTRCYARKVAWANVPAFARMLFQSASIYNWKHLLILLPRHLHCNPVEK